MLLKVKSLIHFNNKTISRNMIMCHMANVYIIFIKNNGFMSICTYVAMYVRIL